MAKNYGKSRPVKVAVSLHNGQLTYLVPISHSTGFISCATSAVGEKNILVEHIIYIIKHLLLQIPYQYLWTK